MGLVQLYIDCSNPIRETNTYRKGSFVTAMLTINPSTTSIMELETRVADVLNHELWDDVQNGYWRSILERAQSGISDVDISALEKVLTSVEALLSQMATGKRRRHLDNARRSLTERSWWSYFVADQPDTAQVLSSPLDKDCSSEQLDAVDNAIIAAKAWSRCKHEERLAKLQIRCTSVTKKADAFAEFMLVNPDAHKLISDGPQPDTNLRTIGDAINAFYDWLAPKHETGSNDATLRVMGLSTAPAGKSNRSKGSKGARKRKS